MNVNIETVVYSKRISETLERLQHAKPITDANSFGTSANFSCGTVIRVGLSIDLDQCLIRDAEVSSNGCGYMLAAAQALADKVTGKTLGALHGLSDAELNSQISESLGKIPEHRSECVVSAVDALRSAFADFRARRIEEFTGEKALICTCFGVAEETIEALVAQGSAGSVEEVADRCNAGSGCGSCRMLIQEMLDMSHQNLSL